MDCQDQAGGIDQVAAVALHVVHSSLWKIHTGDRFGTDRYQRYSILQFWMVVLGRHRFVMLFAVLIPEANQQQGVRILTRELCTGTMYVLTDATGRGLMKYAQTGIFFIMFSKASKALIFKLDPSKVAQMPHSKMRVSSNCPKPPFKRLKFSETVVKYFGFATDSKNP